LQTKENLEPAVKTEPKARFRAEPCIASLVASSASFKGRQCQQIIPTNLKTKITNAY